MVRWYYLIANHILLVSLSFAILILRLICKKNVTVFQKPRHFQLWDDLWMVLSSIADENGTKVHGAFCFYKMCAIH